MHSRFSSLLALVTVFGLASPAWAVVVQVNVKSAAGEPVAGATVKIGELEATTDEDGTAKADVQVEPGTRVEAVVTYRDPRTGREIVVRREFSATEAAQINIALPQPGQLPRPNRVVIPGGLIGGVVGRQVINDSGLERSRFTDVIEARAGTGPIGSTNPGAGTGTGGSTILIRNENREKTPEEIAESNRIERKNHKFGPDGGALFAIPLAGMNGWGRRSTAARWQGGGMPAPESGSSGRGASAWRVHPSATVGFSRASVEFESIDLETAANSQTFSGDGLLYSIGANAVIVPCGECAWYSTVGYQLSRTGTIDMTRTSNIADLVGAGVVVVRDGGEYRYHAHTIRAVVGRVFRHVSPWGGARFTMWQATLELASELDFTQAVGFQAMQSFTATNEYEVNMVEAIGGLDIRLPRTPLFLRVQGSTDGNNHSFGVGFGVGLGR